MEIHFWPSVIKRSGAQPVVYGEPKHISFLKSTLPVVEFYAGEGRPPLRQQALDAMSPQAREDMLLFRQRPRSARPPKIDPAILWKHDLALEHEFVAAGGLLLSGPDPTGLGDVIPGFGDQRGIELLVESGFSPVEAIKIATLNGATYLGREKHIGSVTEGKNADLVVVKGDPSKQISDVENVEIVFKDGVGYDSKGHRDLWMLKAALNPSAEGNRTTPMGQVA